MQDQLIKKIKAGIEKSGFPLEMEISAFLEQNDWDYSVGNIYEDFETGKSREMDISASKTFNGTKVHLMIECKKSTDKQLLLYAPRNQKFLMSLNYYLKAFPKPSLTPKRNEASFRKFSYLFEKLRHYDWNIPFSNSLIVTKGDQVTEDNIKYLTSINGLIKYSIYSGSDGYIETDFRNIYLYFLVFEGSLFQLSSSKTEKFDLKEIEYGQLKVRPYFKYDADGISEHVKKTGKEFGLGFMIEIMTPNHFKTYLIELEQTFNSIKARDLKGWGQPWPNDGMKELKKNLRNQMATPQSKISTVTD